MNSRKIVISTSNRHKIDEIQAIFGDCRIDWMTVHDMKRIPACEETGSSYNENATIKAVAFSKHTGLLALADDSGLEVEALNGLPGIFSNRYFGEDKSYNEKVQLLLKRISHVKEEDRSAKFKCTAILADGEKILQMTQGELEGRISVRSQGDSGFGYDPAFYLPEYQLTVAQLPCEIKNRISHRAQAMLKMKEFLLQLLN